MFCNEYLQNILQKELDINFNEIEFLYIKNHKSNKKIWFKDDINNFLLIINDDKIVGVDKVTRLDMNKGIRDSFMESLIDNRFLKTIILDNSEIIFFHVQTTIDFSYRKKYCKIFDNCERYFVNDEFINDNLQYEISYEILFSLSKWNWSILKDAPFLVTTL